MPTLRQRPPKTQKPDSRDTTSPPARGPKSAATTAMEAAADANDPHQPLLGSTTAPAKEGTGGVEQQRALSGRRADADAPSSTSTSDETEGEEGDRETMENLSRKSQWIVLAVASGGCAAFNGVFAKLTTTELTTKFATWVANLVGLGNLEGAVEVVVRAIFFGLNLIFNAIMWTLFTKALARGTSTTQVSILNTSSNFMLTAVLGWLIFSESLPPLWFLGAALLVAGNVIIGRRDEGEEKDVHGRAENGEGSGREEVGEGLLVAEEVELDEDLDLEERKRKEEQDVLDLGLDEHQQQQGRRGGGSQDLLS
ncbi:uncharacterized protein PAC_14858 [Phialocephala subalpina]|uniref:Transmembrane protein 42 n=1 Tax=Phialocephala subalpina TaxID=576137 RepID=A0A1L7XIW2_9HELO|nr:uncharacterized protein PAC_14858 [Phialocephala subalpina]